MEKPAFAGLFLHAPERIRTSDLRFRRTWLLPSGVAGGARAATRLRPCRRRQRRASHRNAQPQTLPDRGLQAIRDRGATPQQLSARPRRPRQRSRLHVVERQAAVLSRPPTITNELLDHLAATVPDFAQTLRAHSRSPRSLVCRASSRTQAVPVETLVSDPAQRVDLVRSWSEPVEPTASPALVVDNTTRPSARATISTQR